MGRKVYDVTKTNDGWKSTARGGERASAVGDTKEEVVQRAAEIARNQSGDTQVVIHKSDGTIQSERTYGNDPYPPKG